MDSILVITDSPALQYRKDSGTPTLRLFVEAMAKKYTVHIIAPDGPDDEKPNVVWHRIPIQANPNPIFRKWFPIEFTMIAKIRAKSLHLQYQFRMVYGAGCIAIPAAAAIGKQFNIPSVGRLYGTYLLPYLHNPIKLLVKYEEVLAFKSGVDLFIITDDGTGGDDVARRFGIPDQKVRFWRNGVEVPIPVPHAPDNDVRIVSMARLDEWKRVDRIIDAFATLPDNAYLEIVGDGPSRNFLEQRVKASGVGDRATFHGELPRSQALAVLSLSDIFVSTNDYSNVSNSLMEAMAAGKVCIAWNSGKTADLLKDMRGVIVNDENGLAAMLQALVTSSKLRRLYGTNAMEYSRSHFITWDERIKKEVRACDNLIYGVT